VELGSELGAINIANVLEMQGEYEASRMRYEEIISGESMD
jgi:hypothetical protein